MKRPAHITLVNGIETSAIDIADRGVAYGDGIFETMRVLGSDIPLLNFHLDRFLKGVTVLDLGDNQTLKDGFLYYIKQALDEIKTNACLETSLIKMMVTRGSGGRGYTPPENARCNFIVQVFDLPSYPVSYTSEGVVLRECQYRLAYQPQLAGIKHLNRLDQVLASQELQGEAEGLLLNYEGKVIEGTKSNILVFSGEKIITPDLSECGVEGVLRQALLEAGTSSGIDIVTQTLSLNDLKKSDGIALINSVLGSWFVKTLTLQNDTKIQYKKPKAYELIQHYLKKNYAY